MVTVSSFQQPLAQHAYPDVSFRRDMYKVHLIIAQHVGNRLLSERSLVDLLFMSIYRVKSGIGRNPKPSIGRQLQVSDTRYVKTFGQITLGIFQLTGDIVCNDYALTKRGFPNTASLVFHYVEDTLVLRTNPSLPLFVEHIAIDTRSLIEGKGKLIGSQVVIIIAPRPGAYQKATSTERVNTADGIRHGFLIMRLWINIPCLHLCLRTDGIDTRILAPHPDVALMVAHNGGQ